MSRSGSEKKFALYKLCMYWMENKKFPDNAQQCFASLFKPTQTKIQMLTTSCRMFTLIQPSFIKFLGLYLYLILFVWLLYKLEMQHTACTGF